MKKLLVFLLIAVLCLSIVACSDPVETDPESDTDPVVVDTGDSDTDPSTDDPVVTDPPADTDPPEDTDPPKVPEVGADEVWQGIVGGATQDTNAANNPFFELN